MKKQFLKFIALNIFISVVFASCSKYDDGPQISLRSVKNRLSKEWKSETLVYRGQETEIEGMYFAYFDYDKKDNEGYYEIISDAQIISGMFNLADNKTRIVFNSIENDIDTNMMAATVLSSWKINKLTNKKLWIESNFENNDLEIQFIKSN